MKIATIPASRLTSRNLTASYYLDAVRLSSIAAVMQVTTSWLRSLIYQKVMDDIRDDQARGVPYLVHVQQVMQAVVAVELRKKRVGFDSIREAVDAFELDNRKTHVVEWGEFMKLTLKKDKILVEARRILGEAQGLENKDRRKAA